MDVTNLKRDASRILANLKTLPDKSVITTKGIQIHIPAKFFEKGLAESGNEMYVAGHFAYVDLDGYYAVNSTNAVMRIAPITQSKYVVNATDYVVFEFPKGSTVIESTDLVVNNQLPYDVFAFFIDSGYVPWYLSYSDLGRLFSSSIKHANFKVGANPSIVEVMVATIARDPKDLTKYWRHTMKAQADLMATPSYVPFKSVIYGPRTPMSKLLGNYFDAGLTSALVNPTDKVDSVERALRS